MSSDVSRLLTASQAAEALGVTQQHVSKLAKKGRLSPALKAPGLRGALFFHQDEVARVAAERNLS